MANEASPDRHGIEDFFGSATFWALARDFAICGASTLVVAIDSATASANSRSFEPK